jgi:hypothetical protein
VFRPENLLREGRRQRGRPDVPVPAVCLLYSTCSRVANERAESMKVVARLQGDRHADAVTSQAEPANSTPDGDS